MEKVEIEPAKQEYRDLLEVAQKVSAWITDEERMKYFQEQAKAFYDDFVKWEEQEQTPYPLDWLVLPYATCLDAHIGSLISDGKPKKLSIPFDKEKSLRADYVLLTIIHDKRLKNPRTPLISHGIWSEDEEWVVEKWEEISDGYARGSRDIQAHFNSAIKRVEKDLPELPAGTKLENEPQGKGGQGDNEPETIEIDMKLFYKGPRELLKALILTPTGIRGDLQKSKNLKTALGKKKIDKYKKVAKHIHKKDNEEIIYVNTKKITLKAKIDPT